MQDWDIDRLNAFSQITRNACGRVGHRSQGLTSFPVKCLSWMVIQVDSESCLLLKYIDDIKIISLCHSCCWKREWTFMLQMQQVWKDSEHRLESQDMVMACLSASFQRGHSGGYTYRHFDRSAKNFLARGHRKYLRHIQIQFLKTNMKKSERYQWIYCGKYTGICNFCGSWYLLLKCPDNSCYISI